MKKVQVEFVVHLNKEIYQKVNPESGASEFINEFVFNHIVDDAVFIENLLKKEHEEEKQKKYELYVKTLRDMKSDIMNSAQFEIVCLENSMEEVKVKCHFMYHENEIANKNEMVVNEIFTQGIKKNDFLSEDLVRFLKDPRVDELKLKNLIECYAHVRDFLKEAQLTCLVDNEIVSHECRGKTRLWI